MFPTGSVEDSSHLTLSHGHPASRQSKTSEHLAIRRPQVSEPSVQVCTEGREVGQDWFQMSAEELGSFRSDRPPRQLAQTHSQVSGRILVLPAQSRHQPKCMQ